MAFKTPASQRPATNPTYAPTRPGAGPTSSSSLSRTADRRRRVRRAVTARPEFLGLFVVIGRVGRNLGMYLLLASQRLDEGGTT
jgi:hypothetical protein